MSDWLSKLSFAAGLALATLISGCDSGVGDPCVPEEEFLPDFSGFSLEQTNVESRSFQCETRICLVNHFEGRVSCPYGQVEADLGKSATDPTRCRIPGSQDPVAVEVLSQRTARRADDSVYCSCRCAGPDKNARYCDCPSGYGCVKLVDDYALGRGGQLAGSYCIKDGTAYVPKDPKYGELCLEPGKPLSEAKSCGNNKENP